MISKPSRRRRIWTYACSAGFVTFVAAQFIRPAISQPPVTADLVAPDNVKQILRTSCYDCHSNETRLAWFDEIVPAYWLVASDVKNGRRHLNFSEIGRVLPAQRSATLYEAVNQVQLGAMPLPAYARLHRAALVAPAQLSVLKNYLNPPATAAAESANDLAADEAQYNEWIHEGKTARVVAPALNGIEFPHGYKNWKAISTTDRFDNQTLRAVLGNDLAIDAIAKNQTNVWPDGTMFAKVAWFARDDGKGHLHPGAFEQVEFMIRDRQKYPATKGWGWARWRGTGLVPYGKDPGFAAECVGCHAPLRNNDYVFTVPVRAALSGSLPWNPLRWNVITTSVDKQTAAMSTLYGNDAAVQYARSNSKKEYPAGSVLSLVTWIQQEDPHWFGARIPGAVKSVEFVSVTAGPANQNLCSYKTYEGASLARTSTSDGCASGSRAAYLLSPECGRDAVVAENVGRLSGTIERGPASSHSSHNGV